MYVIVMSLEITLAVSPSAGVFSHDRFGFDSNPDVNRRGFGHPGDPVGSGWNAGMWRCANCEIGLP
jgi:hypothetical protein